MRSEFAAESVQSIRACHLCSNTLDAPYFANLGKGLASRGITLAAVGSLRESESPPWVYEVPGTRYFSLDARGRHNYPVAALRLARLLRRERIDVLQTHLFDAAILGVLAARLAGTRVAIVARHHLDEPQLLGGRLHVEIDRWLARTANCIVVPSQAVKSYMKSYERLTVDNVEVIPYGFDFEALDAT